MWFLSSGGRRLSGEESIALFSRVVLVADKAMVLNVVLCVGNGCRSWWFYAYVAAQPAQKTEVRGRSRRKSAERDRIEAERFTKRLPLACDAAELVKELAQCD
jgi:hypothetical protein